jgi:hypothetical protein
MRKKSKHRWHAVHRAIFYAALIADLITIVTARRTMSSILLRALLAAASQKTLSNHNTFLMGACMIVVWTSIQAGVFFYAIQSQIT